MRTLRIGKYFSSLDRLSAVFDQKSRRLPLRAGSRSECLNWQGEVRTVLRELLGLDQMCSCELKPTLLESVELDYGRREKWLVQTEPEVWMPFYVLLPTVSKHAGPVPVVIALHGHRGAGKFSVAGRDDIPAVRSAIEHYCYDYGRKFCTEGYVVFCPDARGFGERRECYRGPITEENEFDEAFFLESSCSILNQKAISLGLTLAGMWTWDLMRLIDYIATQADCDPARICCAGLSGGGLQTLWLSAFEPRLTCSIVSGNFFGLKDSIISLTRCSCSYVPHLCEYVDVGDIGALSAPRPLLIESGSQDELSGARGLQNVTEQVEITRHAYAAFGACDRFHHHVFDGPHRWNGEKTYPFVRQWI